VYTHQYEQRKNPTHQIKAAIFDMDGTMINNMAHHKRAWQEFLRRHNITLAEEEFRHKISGKKNDQIFELVFGRKLDSKEERQYADEKEAIYRELYKPDIQEIEGLTRIIDALHQRGIRTAIATTAIAKNRDFALETLGLEGKFEIILGDEHVTHGKPNPEIYLSTAKELGVSPAECIVLEDSPPGVEAGKAAGMVVIGILSSHAAEELNQADYVVEHFNQIKLA
jgi:beta-phosphoglucomutase